MTLTAHNIDAEGQNWKKKRTKTRNSGGFGFRKAMKIEKIDEFQL